MSILNNILVVAGSTSEGPELNPDSHSIIDSSNMPIKKILKVISRLHGPLAMVLCALALTCMAAFVTMDSQLTAAMGTGQLQLANSGLPIRTKLHSCIVYLLAIDGFCRQSAVHLSCQLCINESSIVCIELLHCFDIGLDIHPGLQRGAQSRVCNLAHFRICNSCSPLLFDKTEVQH